mmetsp:Transcript_26415/g.86834  ORF Transcript_26415/g.86834 Transcript_26415/m.86834 type:complete len:214 (+) Transcript_26415:1578-2219(+)
MRLDGVEVQYPHADDGEGWIHQEHDQPSVEQSLEEHALLLLFDVVDRSFIPRDSEQGNAEAEDERQGPVVLERLAQVGCHDLGVLHHECGGHSNQEAHGRDMHDENSNRKEGALSDSQDAQDTHQCQQDDGAPVDIQLRNQVGGVCHALCGTHYCRRHVRQERQTCGKSSHGLGGCVKKKTVRASIQRNRGPGLADDGLEQVQDTSSKQHADR